MKTNTPLCMWEYLSSRMKVPLQPASLDGCWWCVCLFSRYMSFSVATLFILLRLSPFSCLLHRSFSITSLSLSLCLRHSSFGDPTRSDFFFCFLVIAATQLTVDKHTHSHCHTDVIFEPSPPPYPLLSPLSSFQICVERTHTRKKNVLNHQTSFLLLPLPFLRSFWSKTAAR